MSTSTIAPETGSLKTRLKQTWMSGDYDRFSRYMEQDAREFYERLDIPPGSKMLDVGCGSGQVALCAAREGVMSPALISLRTLWSVPRHVLMLKV